MVEQENHCKRKKNKMIKNTGFLSLTGQNTVVCLVAVVATVSPIGATRQPHFCIP
jgi:hypothetical protein